MNVKKVLFILALIGVFSACSESDPIYGSWSGSSNGKNSYTIIGEDPPDRIKSRLRLPSNYSRVVNLTLSKDDCRIVFDSNFDDPVDCVYVPEKKVIVIPLWRNKDSISDSGLVITKLGETTLELENQFTRIFTDNFEYKHEMKGTENYSLTKSD